MTQAGDTQATHTASRGPTTWEPTTPPTLFTLNLQTLGAANEARIRGVNYLVVPSVMLISGVRNGELVPAE